MKDNQKWYKCQCCFKIYTADDTNAIFLPKTFCSEECEEVEFELLEECEKDLAKAKDLVKAMERRYNDLYARIYGGSIVPHELLTKVARMKEELED